MLQDTDFFTNLESVLSIGDVLATLTWAESASPDERYMVNVLWRFRGERVGDATFVIEPRLNTNTYSVWWVHLAFIEDWQDKGLYSTIVEQLSPYLRKHRITHVYAPPWDKEAERRLASRGFVWVDNQFVLDLSPQA